MSVFNAFIAYKFIKILSLPWKDSDAYKLGIVDDKGKILKKRKQLKTSEERKAYTIFHQLIWNLRKILEKVPIFRSRLATFATALYLIKEQSGDTGTLIEDAFLEYLRENNYDVNSMLINESFKDRKTTIRRGLYVIEGKKIFVEKNTDAFDEICGIPLFKIDFLGEERIMVSEDMKPFRKYFKEDGVGANAVGGGENIAGLDGKPPVSKKNQKVHRRKAVGVTGGVKESVETFAGSRIFKVTPEEYVNCLQGRKKHERWKRKLNMDEFSNTEIRKYAHRNPGKSVIVQNEKTGEMSYLVR